MFFRGFPYIGGADMRYFTDAAEMRYFTDAADGRYFTDAAEMRYFTDAADMRYFKDAADMRYFTDAADMPAQISFEVCIKFIIEKTYSKTKEYMHLFSHCWPQGSLIN